MRRDYFGRDFIYRIEEDEPMLYSVGSNQFDDGADDSGDPPLDEVYLHARQTETWPSRACGSKSQPKPKS